MQPVTEENLDPKLHNLFLKAQSAIELLNYDYAISLLHGILKEDPTFLKGREILRAAQGARARGQKKKMSLSGGFMKIKGLVKKDPASAIEEIEKKLDDDPYNVDGNTLLYDAFMGLGAPELAVFGLETIREGHPENTKSLHKLGDHYIAQGDGTMAAKIYGIIAEVDPSDGDARKKAKDASAQATMTKTGLGSGAGLKDLLKSADETEALEKASQKGATKEQMQERLATLGAQYAENPQDLHVVKDIASVYEQLEQWEDAASYYDYAHSLSESDATLQRQAEDMRDKQREQVIKELETAIADGGEGVEDKEAQLKELKQSNLDGRIAQAKERVESNPTDPQLRFDLGAGLYEAEEFRDAIPHLQKAKNNPHIRIRSMLMLGRCYDSMKMYDLAIGTLVEANGELFAMDNTKKEVLYTLGCIYDTTEDKPKALEAFKEIYNTDYDYRDVAKRVEDSYDG